MSTRQQDEKKYRCVVLVPKLRAGKYQVLLHVFLTQKEYHVQRSTCNSTSTPTFIHNYMYTHI
jgi:hypothetical protein